MQVFFFERLQIGFTCFQRCIKLKRIFNAVKWYHKQGFVLPNAQTLLWGEGNTIAITGLDWGSNRPVVFTYTL